MSLPGTSRPPPVKGNPKSDPGGHQERPLQESGISGGLILSSALQFITITIPRVIIEAKSGEVVGEDYWQGIGNAMVAPFVILFSLIVAGTVVSNSKIKNIGRNLRRMALTMGVLSVAASIVVFLYPATAELRYVFTVDGNLEWNGYLIYLVWAAFQGACLVPLVRTLKIRKSNLKNILVISLGVCIPSLIFFFIETFYMPITGYDTIAVLITGGTFLAGGITMRRQSSRYIEGGTLKRWLKIYIVSLFSSFGLLLTWFVLFGVSNFYLLYYYPYTVPKTTLSTGELILAISIAAVAVVLTLALLATKMVLDIRESMRKAKRYLKKSLTTITAGIAVFALIGSAPLSYFSSITLPFWSYQAGPYITWSDGQDPATSISICWRTPFATGTSLRYGTDPRDLNLTASNAERDMLHKLRIGGLQANTTYYYKIGGFDLKQFTTAPVGNATFTFSVWSDPRTNNGYTAILDRPNLPLFMDSMINTAGVTNAFSLCTGDIVGRGPDQNSWKLWLTDITTNDFASNASHVVAIGNHEHHDDIEAVNFHRYYPYANTTFSFDYGQLHVIILDIYSATKTGDPWWTTVPAHLMTWMEQDLLASTATFNILGLHPTPINWDGTPANDTHNGDIGVDLMNLADNYGLDVIFSGHSHRYTHALHNSTHYFTLGIGGNFNNNFAGDAGFAMVHVDGSNMTIDLYQLSNESVFDSYSILK